VVISPTTFFYRT